MQHQSLMNLLGFLLIVFFVFGLTCLFAQLFGVWDKHEKPNRLKQFFFYSFIIAFWGFIFYQGYIIETTPFISPR